MSAITPSILQPKQKPFASETRSSKTADTFLLMTAGVLLVWSVAAAIVSSTTFEQTAGVLLLYSFICMAVARLIFTNKYTMIFTGSVLLVAALFIAGDHFIGDNEYGSVYLRLEYFFTNMALYINGFIPHEPIFETTAVLLIIGALTLVVAIFAFVFFNFFLLFALGCVAFVLILTSGFFHYHFSFYVFIFAILSYLIKYLNTNSFAGTRLTAPFTAYILPLTLACVMLATLLPMPDASFSEDLRDRLIMRPFNRINRFLYTSFRPANFSLAQTGFGGGSGRRLGGDITPNHEIFMRVRTEGPIYLTGAVLDTYTGFSWVNTRTANEPMYFGGVAHNLEWFERASSTLTLALTGSHVQDDFLTGLIFMDILAEEIESAFGVEDGMAYFFEHMDGVLFIDSIEPAHIRINNVLYGLRYMQGDTFAERYLDFLRVSPHPRAFEVDIMDFRMFTVFQNGIVAGIVSDGFDPFFIRDGNSAISTRDRMPRHSRYTVITYELPPEMNRLPLLTASHRGILWDAYDNLLTLQAHGFNTDFLYFEASGLRLTYQEFLGYLIERADWIHEVYTELPYDFPERVRTLAYSVTAHAENDFQRAMLLEMYLRRFEYTLHPGPTPIDQDFVDHFLFDLQRGYCVHFATAFVTMARSIGLPARYVEGFNVVGTHDEYGFINVANSLGHAWGEVYFEGFGWHMFEPTPGGGLIGLFDETVIAQFAVGIGWEDLFDYEYEDWMYMWDPLGLGVLGYTPSATEPGYYYDDTSEATGLLYVILLSTAVVSGLVIFGLIIRIIMVLVKESQAKKKYGNDAVNYRFRQMLAYCELHSGAKIKPYETALQFGQRIGNRFGFENETVGMEVVAGIFTKARFSGQEVTSDEKKLVDRAVVHIDKRTKKTMGFWRYAFNRYILGNL